MLEYYNAVELEPLIEAVVEAHHDLDMALEKREAAIKALAEGWNAIEARRSALAEAAE